MEGDQKKQKNRTLGQLEKDNYENLSESEKEGLVNMWQAFARLVDTANNLWPQQHKQAFDLLLKTYGWHMRMWMSFDDLTPLVIKNDGSIDRYFIKSLWWSLWRIRIKAIKRFPHRKRAINLAFKAHIMGEYELSVPAFLILSEGIFREMSGGDIFAKRSKEKEHFIEQLKVNKKVPPLIPYTIEAVINGEIIGLRFSNGDDLAYPNVLHRNRIIHGVDIKYGTKVNSYKAISQFEFIIDTVYMGFTEDLSLLNKVI